jgi:hypothetical protein
LVSEYRHSNGEEEGQLLGRGGDGIGAGQGKGDAGRNVSGCFMPSLRRGCIMETHKGKIVLVNKIQFAKAPYSILIGHRR